MRSTGEGSPVTPASDALGVASPLTLFAPMRLGGWSPTPVPVGNYVSDGNLGKSWSIRSSSLVRRQWSSANGSIGVDPHTTIS